MGVNPFANEATDRTMDSFVAAHQDKSKNALSKALEASFVAWVEELKADQAQFSSEKVSTLSITWIIIRL